MRIERTKNATRNIVFGVSLKIYTIVVPFFLRTAMLYFMGVEYLGLNSLFSSVLQVLNLAELGVGSAMVYSMYKPIAEDDTVAICALMRLYRFYYRVIGGVIAAAGLMLTPLIPYLIKSDLPTEMNVYALYLLNLGATVLTYWLFAYKNSLFSAHQRTDVSNRISLITSSLQYAIQLYIIIIVKDYYLYVIVMLFTQALTNIITSIAATKMYRSYRPKGKLEKSFVQGINHRIRGLFTARLGGVILSSADTVVISAFLGLTALAVYQNYYYIISAVIGLVAVFFSACTAGVGNSIIVETKEKNFNDFKKITFLVCWISGFCTCCLLCLSQPFMKIWVGEDLMLQDSAVLFFCAYFFVYEILQIFNLFKDAAGLWHEDRFRPLVSAVTNLFLNLLTIPFWGIYGVIFSTIVALLGVEIPWILYNLFHLMFDQSLMGGYLKLLCKYVAVVAMSCVCCVFICSFVQLSDWGTLILDAILCCILPNLIYFLAYRKTDEFQSCLKMVSAISKMFLSGKKHRPTGK